ncbi:brefeldin A-inhibited guanine nucleotide-exchange protein 3 [Scophthalmus maximus]|uniref:brefeldin A-inhibited guanine nucleotide-exchange protein 3 n=1 Tax=Scophthalmus maximus TaxID=52904 RepID=UPI001FA87FC1|nr:brefeldin A-inhibited guanine nucleotide-exchange protein 3 [Scophthalmus maximus]
MEEILRKLHKDASGHKHKGIRDACVSARETLASPSRSAKVSASQLREICLLPLQMALESKNSRLGQTALAGMQKLLCEERFVGGVGEEAELREKQLVSKMLEAVRVTPALHEDLQVEVMKVLLCITYSPNFDINGDSILRIAEVCIETYLSSCHQRSINTAVRATLSQILGDLALQLRHRQEGADGDEATPLQRKDVSPTSQALCEDVVTVLTVFCEKLESVDSENQLLQLLYLECLLSMLSSCPPTMHLSRGFTDLVWKQLCPSLVAIMGNPVNDKTITSHHGHTGAVDRDRLSDRPSLGINQDADSCGGGVSDQGRGSGCSSSAPARIAPVVRTVCYIAAELVRLVSCVESMKPVLQSLYHRILLYPPPQHRTEAIRIMKEILGSPQRLYDLAGPCVAEPETRKRSFSKRKSHLDLLKLVMDGMTEACVKGGIEACYSSVSCACALLGALDELSQGRGLQPEQARLLLRRLDDLRDGTESTRESVEINEADFRWQRHVLSSEQPAWDPASNMAAMGAAERSPDISISITTETGQTTLDLEGEGEGLGLGQGHTTPEECGEDAGLPSLSLCGGREVAKREERAEPDLRNRQGEGGGRAGEVEGRGGRGGGGGGGGGGVVPPDVVQRSHGLVYPDITNFLSVESRTRSHHVGGSRYSESNFSVEEQDLSRTEFDSCDQYSMAAEKDSGRSDVSDMGSDNVSLADEEQQTPRDCPGHRSLRSAALSLKLLRHQEADQQSARLFVQSLATLLPRLLGLATAAEVDLTLQSFSSNFCSGLQAGGIHSPGFETGDSLSCQSLMNADGLYLVSYYALLLNLKLCCCDYYRRRTLAPALGPKEFVRLIQSSGVLVVLSQVWIEELYHQVLERNLLAEAGYWGSPEEHTHTLPLITMLTDIDGLGSSAIGGQLIRRPCSQLPIRCDKTSSDSATAGAVFSRFILTGVWRNLMDVLSTPLTGRMAGSSRGLAFILGAEGLKEQSQRERDAICLSLDGLRKAAALSCALGVAANCASALAQMAAASCVQEEKDEKEVGETGDAITQVKQRVEQRLEQMSRPQGVRLHTAHVLCMDAILNVGLEMGSHNHDCWPHVFRVTEYISSLEHTHFSDGSPLPSSLTTITQQSQQAAAGVDQGLELSCEPSPEASELGLSQPVIQPLSIQELLRESGRAGGRGLDLRGGSLMTGHGAATAVCTLSTQADRLFEEAATKLNMVGLVFFLQQLRKASQSQLFDSVTETGDYSLAMPGEAKSTLEHRSLLLCRLGEAMLRIARNKNRPLLHMMRAWSVVAPHLVEAACHKERHVSQRAVSFIHDVLLEVLTSWAELPHFHVNEALFRPLEHAMQLELCDEDVQDQVVTSIGELVEMCSPQILSGWRPLFSALRTVHSSKTDTKDYLLGEYAMGKSQAPVFDVFEAFINTDNIQVFANAATDYIMCLMKFVKGLGEVDYKEIGDCVLVSGHSSTDLCLPALDYLRRCSQLLAKIYRMPSKPVFLGARLASLPMRSQERSVSSEDGMDCVLQEFDDDTGLIQVWILLLEQLTAAVSNCPRQHQPPTLELLFSLLREVTSVPGPGFAIFSVIQLLLPVMSLWLQRSHGDHAYWDMAAANFKHAIGLSCELVVEHVNSFIHSDIGYESQINLMLKDLFKLLVSCVSEPAETISRVGCSCIRYVLVTVGPVFTEEMWRLACCALQDAFSATLEPVKNLLACFHSGSDSFSGDACEVKVAAPSHSPSAEAEYWRIKAMAQQVFMLDTQCSPKTPSSKDGFEHAQSCVLIIEMPSDQLSNGHAQKRKIGIPFRTIVVSLLSHQVLLQNLSDILLEEFVKQPEGHERVTPVTSDPGRPTAGFLRYISMTNLAIILDLLLDSYRTARDFDTRPGLKYLLMKVSGVCGAANLYRQSAMSFNLYFQALLSATLSQADGMTAQQVKRILYEEEEHSSDSSHPGSASSEDEDIFEETAQVSPPRGRDKRHQWRAPIPSLSVQPLGGGDWAWLVKRLYKLCMDLCNSYIQMHRDLESTLEEAALLRGGGGGGGGGGDHIFLLPLFQSETSTPTSVGGLSARGTPSEDGGYRCQVADVSAASPGDTPTPSPGLSCTGSLPRRDSGATASSGGGAPGSVGTGRRKEWWESAGNKLYTIATDKTISKLMLEYKRRKQQQPPPQSHVNLFMKEQGRAGSAAGGGIVGEPQRPPQRPQQLVDQQGPPLRHSVSAGPEVLRQEKRPRSGSTISSHSISLRDSEAQIQAWTNMVLTLLNQTLLLTDASFLALQPALYPCLSQLSCHVTDARVRQALREWLGRVGRLYDIIL